MEPVTEPAKYHVFINHRGPDTKMNIASLIHRELERCGLNVFLDMSELQPGDIIIPAIEKAIDSASIHITIFSKRYAESRPCLQELCRILKSSHQRKIIPVFYDVQPCQLRGIEREPYAKAFQKHQCNDKVAKEVVAEWKKALRDVSELPGLVFITAESNYAKFLDEIVQLVL